MEFEVGDTILVADSKGYKIEFVIIGRSIIIKALNCTRTRTLLTERSYSKSNNEREVYFKTRLRQKL